MVLMEKALSISQTKRDDLVTLESPNDIIKKAKEMYSELAVGLNNVLSCQVQTVKTQLKYIVREKTESVELYNMEPFAGPPTYIDMGINLYNMESSQ